MIGGRRRGETAAHGSGFERREQRVEPGVDLDENFHPHRDAGNWWQQDRTAMKNGSWCGIEGFPLQDVACQESMGAIVDRRHEHLGTSDVAIIRLRESARRATAASLPS